MVLTVYSFVSSSGFSLSYSRRVPAKYRTNPQSNPRLLSTRGHLKSVKERGFKRAKHPLNLKIQPQMKQNKVDVKSIEMKSILADISYIHTQTSTSTQLTLKVQYKLIPHAKHLQCIGSPDPSRKRIKIKMINSKDY